MPATEQTESAGQAGQILDCSHGWWLWAAALSYATRQQFFFHPPDTAARKGKGWTADELYEPCKSNKCESRCVINT